MKIFISWSGDRSGGTAKSLADWIPFVLPNVKPWISSHDIAPGTRWATELTSELATCQFGIICLTKENLASPWILFEAGSLAKQFQLARVVPYLFDLKPTEIKFPLAQFQSVEASKAGTRDLLASLNGLLDVPVAEDRLNRAFDKWWPELEQRLTSIAEKSVPAQPPRSDREILEEVLEIARTQYRSRSQPISFLGAFDARTNRHGVRALVFWHRNNFAYEEARELCTRLESSGLPTVMVEHIDPQCPDALFIGALVGAEDARLVIKSIPYKINFIFRPDYPAPQGGDDSGLTIGIGYISSHYHRYRKNIAQPIPVTEADIKELTKPGLSNTEFQASLRRLTWPT